MSTINAVQSTEVRSAIARAANATGVQFDYLLAQAKLESGLDTGARASTSSAAGLYQFISGTWLETVDRHGAEHGLGWADQAISRVGGRAVVSDPAMRAQIMALRHDPDVASLMAAELANDNAAGLREYLGRDADASELYLAHFMGLSGARDFLGALQSDPSRSAAIMVPRAAAANRAIFYDSGRARDLGEVMTLMRDKVAGAMESGQPAPTGAYRFDFAAATPARAFGQARDMGGDPGQSAPRARPSMADTLRETFGAMDSGSGAGGARVAAAYGKLKAFGL